MAKTAAEILARPEFVKIVAEAVSTTASQYTHLPTAIETTQLQLQSEEITPSTPLDVGAFIRFDSPQFTAEIFMGWSFKLFATYFETLTQDRPEAITRENQDLPGEILNIAFGIVDPRTRQPSFQLRSSFPKSLSGPDLKKLLKELPKERVDITLKAAGQIFPLWIFPAGTIKHNWGYTLKQA